MKTASLLDFYQCRVCFDTTRFEPSSLRDFYLPLIGADAFATFFALLGENGSARKHDGLLRRLNLTPGEYENALKALEAVGLVRTFVQDQGDSTLFLYCLYAPLTLDEFDADVMLSGTLKGRIGEEEYALLKGRHIGEETPKDMEEVTISFPEFFKPAFDPKFYLGAGEKGKTRGKARAKTGFDSALFQREIEKLGMRKGGISSPELEQISKLAALYGLNEIDMARFAFDCVLPNAPFGRKVDMVSLGRRCAEAMPFTFYRAEKGESSDVKSDTTLGQMIKMMDEVSPAKFLQWCQGGHKPAESDLKLVERLTLQIGLPSPCVNALLSYTLQTHDNALPSAYCEKVAAAMVREGCRSARDAMDYLTRGRRGRKKTPVISEKTVTSVTPETTASGGDEENVSEQVEALLKDLYGD